MVILIKLTSTNGEEFFFNADRIRMINESEIGGSIIRDIDCSPGFCYVKESPKVIDQRIDAQIKNLIHHV